MPQYQEWYAWIPTLTGDVFLNDIHDLLIKSRYSINREKTYSKYIRFSDNPNSKRKDILLLTILSDHSGSLESYNFLLELQEIEVSVKCVIERKGIVMFSADYNKLSDDFGANIINALYFEIKNIFHEHTHHLKENDRLLKVVQAETREHAVDKIIHQYLMKVFLYHHYLKNSLSEISIWSYLLQSILSFFPLKRKFPHGIHFVYQAEGEMLYASLFLNIFQNDISKIKLDNYTFIIQNAYKSFNDISNKIHQMLQDYTNKTMIFLTLLILLLTSVICF